VSTKRKRKKKAVAAGSSAPPKKRKRKRSRGVRAGLHKRKRKRKPAAARTKRKRSSTGKRKRSSSPRRLPKWHTQPGRGRGFKFEVTRVKVDRRGYDPSGKFWGKNSREAGKLYRVRVIDRATDLYSDSFVHAHTQTEAKAKVSATMVQSLAPKHATHSSRTHGSFGGIASESFPGYGPEGVDMHGMHFGPETNASVHANTPNLQRMGDRALTKIVHDGRAHSTTRQLAALILRERGAAAVGDIDQQHRFQREAEYVYERAPSHLRWARYLTWG
jgi:hypothetical protein